MDVAERIWSKLEEVYSLDLRSLGVFRIFLGAIFIGDLIVRSFDLKAFYSDYGVMPREVLLDSAHRLFHISINMISGEVWVQAVIFTLAGIAGFLYMIGYRSRLMAFICFFFAISIQMRNPIVLNSGDNLYRLMFFFSMFLPVSARYSVDNLIGNNKEINLRPNQYGSIATIGFLIQVCLIYLVTGLHKVPGAEWQNGQAVYYVMHAELFSSDLGYALTAYPKLMEFLTHVTLYLELYGWLLIFIPIFLQYFRLLGVAIFIGLHLSFMFCMHLGFFPWIDIAAWIPIIPGLFWDKMNFAFIERWKDKIGGVFKKLVAAYESREFYRPKVYRYALGYVGTLLMLIYIPLMIAWNFQALKYFTLPVKAQRVMQYPALWQSWKMFAPNPIKNDGWFVWEAQLRGGQKVDLRTKEPVNFEKPDDLFATAFNQRWRKYLRNVMTNKKYKGMWLNISRFMAKEWNKEHGGTDKELETLSIFFMKEKTLPDYQPSKVVKENKYNYWTQLKFKDRFKSGGGDDIPRPVNTDEIKRIEKKRKEDFEKKKAAIKKNKPIKLDAYKKSDKDVLIDGRNKPDPKNVDKVVPRN